VRQRVALERKLQELPPLRAAWRAGRLTYEQARTIARVATPEDVEARIDAAASKTCIALQREVASEEKRQMWNEGELRAVVPESVASLLAEAMRSARLHSGRNLTPGEALLAIAIHFIEVWAVEVMRRVKRMHPAMLRDLGRCQVPGCSHPASHVHHIEFRSTGGSDDGWNLVCVCAPHHLRAIHGGLIRVSGRAPDGLTWEFPGAEWEDPRDAVPPLGGRAMSAA